MISILIPVYNYDCSLLIKELAAQSLQLKEELDGEFDYEIIVSDDASTDLNKQKINMTAALTTGSTYIQQKRTSAKPTCAMPWQTLPVLTYY